MPLLELPTSSLLLNKHITFWFKPNCILIYRILHQQHLMPLSPPFSLKGFLYWERTPLLTDFPPTLLAVPSWSPL